MENKENLLSRIEKGLQLVRPYLQADGGDITLIEVTDDLTVRVRMEGACGGCPFSMQTLKAGVEQNLRREAPEIKEVIAVA